jgi:hypothetical protein
MSYESLYRRDPDSRRPEAPDAPMIEVVLTYNNRSRRCLALIDSGSPISTITAAVRQQLQPKKKGQDLISGATDKRSVLYSFYWVDVTFAGTQYQNHPLYDLETSAEVMIIGRDILNAHNVLLDGPARQVSID